MKNIVLAILISNLFFVCACRPPIADDPKNINQINFSPLDYGNNVYYFSTIGAEFGNALSGFLKNHPELRLLSIAPDENGRKDGRFVGTISGYFVIFEKRNQSNDFML